PVGPKGLFWMIDQGILELLVDGLDEILATDDSFFNDFLLERLTVPNGGAQITVCVRDSLFNTCRSLAEFLEQATDQVEVFQLDKWEFETKRLFAKRRFRNDESQAERFLQAIQA